MPLAEGAVDLPGDLKEGMCWLPGPSGVAWINVSNMRGNV